MPNDNTQLITGTTNRLAAIEKSITVQGMTLSAPAKSGARRLVLMKKKDFKDAFKKQTPDATDKQATRAFDQYRQATLKEFNAKLATEFANGNLVAERLNADGAGNLRTIALVKAPRVAADQVVASVEVTARTLGWTRQQTDAAIAQAKANLKANGGSIEAPDIDVVSREVEETNAAINTPDAPVPAPNAAPTDQGQPNTNVVNPPQAVAAQ